MGNERKAVKKTFQEMVFVAVYPRNLRAYNSKARKGHPRIVWGLEDVVAIFWARVSCRLVVEDACFRMRITLGVVLIRSLVSAKCVPGRIRSGSGAALN